MSKFILVTIKSDSLAFYTGKVAFNLDEVVAIAQSDEDTAIVIKNRGGTIFLEENIDEISAKLKNLIA